MIAQGRVRVPKKDATSIESRVESIEGLEWDSNTSCT
jgi:hypothetical protein